MCGLRSVVALHGSRKRAVLLTFADEDWAAKDVLWILRGESAFVTVTDCFQDHSADSGQLLAKEYIDDAGASDIGLHEDHAAGLLDDFSDDAAVGAEGMGLHGGEDAVCDLGRDDGDDFALVGDVEGIEAEHFTGSANGFADGNVGLAQVHPGPGAHSDFVENGGDAAAGGIAHDADAFQIAGGFGFVEHGFDQAVERGAVARKRAFELEAFALRKNSDAVVADIAAEEDSVPGPGAIGGEARGAVNVADAGGGNEDLVALAAIDDLGVSGDELDAGVLRGGGHGVGDAGELGRGETLFEDEGGGKVEGCGSADRQVVDGAVDGEGADVAAGKEDGGDDKGVGGKGETRAGDVEDRLVVHAVEGGIAEAGDEDLVDELGGELAAAAVAEDDLGVVEDRQRAGAEGIERSGTICLGRGWACRSAVFGLLRTHQRPPPMETRSWSFRWRP